jgi:hypothetical protein
MNAAKHATPLPADFPDFTGDRKIVDSLILMLLQERASLSDPTWRATALARIENARRAMVDFGDAPYFSQVRHELLVNALDWSAKLDGPIEQRVAFVEVVLGEAIPNVPIAPGVIRKAVDLWPKTKQRTARARAVRELARALHCDVPSLPTMLREARSRIRNRLAHARRN